MGEQVGEGGVGEERGGGEGRGGGGLVDCLVLASKIAHIDSDQPFQGGGQPKGAKLSPVKSRAKRGVGVDGGEGRGGGGRFTNAVSADITCDKQLAASVLGRGQIVEQPHDPRDDALIERLALGRGGAGKGARGPGVGIQNALTTSHEQLAPLQGMWQSSHQWRAGQGCECWKRGGRGG